MKFSGLRIALALVVWMGLCGLVGHAQFKKIYRLDSLVLLPPSSFGAVKVLETDLPNQEIAVIGTLSTMDTANVSRSEMYNLLCNVQGQPQNLHMFEDTSQFVFLPGKAYTACYDGNGSFFYGVGANSRQVIFRSDANGQLLWSRQGNHHEYYSLICEGGSATVMGQDESIQGTHDFSIANFDENGGGGGGTMFGTTSTDVPQKMAKIDGNYLLVGSAFRTGGFDGLVIKADAAFNHVWGRRIEIPGKSLFITGVVEPLDGNGYLLSGRARAGVDSMLVMKVDDAGNAVWTKLIGLDNASEYYTTAMVMDPVTGGCLISGYYKGPQYMRPVVVKTDSTGQVLWTKDYGDPGINTDEQLIDMIYRAADSMVYAVGDMVRIDSSVFEHNIFMLKFAADSGSVPCDSLLSAAGRMLTPQLSSVAMEEPFLANSHFPIGNMIATTMVAETRCEVFVGTEDAQMTQGLCQLVNPSGPALQMKIEVPENGAHLVVSSLTGTVIWSSPLEAGLQQPCIAMPQLSDGLYLVQVSGADWRYPTLRWVIQR